MWIPRKDWDKLRQTMNHEMGELRDSMREVEKTMECLPTIKNDIVWLKKIFWWIAVAVGAVVIDTLSQHLTSHFMP